MFTSIYTGFTLNQDIKRGGLRPVSRPADLAPRHRWPGLCWVTSSAIRQRPVGPGGWHADGLSGRPAVCRRCSPHWSCSNLFALGIGWIFTAVALMVKTPGTVMTLSWLVLMPGHLRLQHLCRSRDPARMVAGLRRGQSGQPHHQRPARHGGRGAVAAPRSASPCSRRFWSPPSFAPLTMWPLRARAGLTRKGQRGRP